MDNGPRLEVVGTCVIMGDRRLSPRPLGGGDTTGCAIGSGRYPSVGSKPPPPKVQTRVDQRLPVRSFPRASNQAPVHRTSGQTCRDTPITRRRSDARWILSWLDADPSFREVTPDFSY